MTELRERIARIIRPWGWYNFSTHNGEQMSLAQSRTRDDAFEIADQILAEIKTAGYVLTKCP